MRAAAPCLAALGLTLALLAGGRGLSQTLPEGAQLLAQEGASRGEALLATARWSVAGGVAPDRVAGAVTTASWQIPAPGLSTLDLGLHWRAELVADGFTPGFACVAADCGGFDFRFAIPVLPEPDMHVDLGDFRYMTFRRDGRSGTEHRAVLISRGAGALYAQITTVLPTPPAKAPPARPPGAEPPAQAIAPPALPQAETPGTGLIALLTGQGRAVLEDLDFASGTADLNPGDYASLDVLGEWLAANPAARVTLVGHTDATGGLAANMALSLRRAQSVRERIASHHDLPAGQVQAEGVGYLAPRASNLTSDGQALNRRVEVVLTQAP